MSKRAADSAAPATHKDKQACMWEEWINSIPESDGVLRVSEPVPPITIPVHQRAVYDRTTNTITWCMKTYKYNND